MSEERILKALAVTDQGLSDQEKSTARSNIGAQGALTAGPNVDITNNVISVPKCTLSEGPNVHIVGITDPSTRVTDYTVSATDTTYSAGSGLYLDDGVFSVENPVPAPASGSTGKVLTVQNDNSLDWETPPSGQTYTFSTGLTESSGTVSVTNPLPDPTNKGGMFLVVSGTTPIWTPQPRYFYKVTLPRVTEITATDITNGYKDIKIGIPNFPTDTYAQSWDWRLDMFDAGVNHGSTTAGLSTHADAIKISVWNENSDWVELDTTGAGMLFENITDTEMTRKGAYPYFLQAIRKVGGAPDRGTLVSGPSMRVMFKSGNPPVAGDTITFIGYITAIRTA